MYRSPRYPSETCAVVVEGGVDFDGDGDDDAIASGRVEMVNPDALSRGESG